VPGVDIAPTSNAPGAALQVRVRGTRSLTASNDPLYVLDGIPLSGGLQDINPNDIASLEVLKDASATAIYGSRGANGVVLITTKQGSRQGGTRISYDGYVGEQRILNRVRMMTGEEFAEYRREAFRTVGRYTNDADIFFPSELQMLQAGQQTDWQSLVLRAGMQASNQLAVSGGNERTRFAISGEQLRQSGITRGQGFGRRSLRLNFDHQPTARVSLGASTLLSRATQDVGRNNSLFSEALLNSPLGPVRDTAGALLFKPTPDGQRVNPLSEVENFQEENARTRAFATLFAEYRLAKGLSLRTNFGPDLSFVRGGRFRGSQTFDRQGGTADARIQEDRTFAYTLDNILSYRRDVGRQDKVDVTLLYGIQAQRFDEHDTQVSGLPYEHQRTYNLGSAGRVESVGSNLEEWRLQSYMARVNYDLRGRYLLTVTGRADGSSRLAPGQKYGLFPSVAVGWRASDERFLRDRGWFDELKLRASVGRTGNTGINPYQTQGSLGRTTYAFGDAAAFGYRPAVLPNPNLQWETTTQLDAGRGLQRPQEPRLGHGRLLPLAHQRPAAAAAAPRPTTGFNQILENVGATSNTGLEVGLTTVNVERPGRGGFRWSTTANWSTNRNRIVALSGGGNDVGSRRFVGQPISVWYDLQFAGIWQLADSLEARRYGRTPGQIRVVDQNDDGRITQDADRVVLGSPFPDWIGSLSNRLDWKGFDLNVLATARQGFMLNSWFHSSLNQLFGRYNNLKVDYWTPTNPSNTNPRPNRDQESPLNGGARAYRDGSFVRVRNVTLGYAIPPRLVGARGGAVGAALLHGAGPLHLHQVRRVRPRGGERQRQRRRQRRRRRDPQLPHPARRPQPRVLTRCDSSPLRRRTAAKTTSAALAAALAAAALGVPGLRRPERGGRHGRDGPVPQHRAGVRGPGARHLPLRARVLRARARVLAHRVRRRHVHQGVGRRLQVPQRLHVAVRRQRRQRARRVALHVRGDQRRQRRGGPRGQVAMDERVKTRRVAEARFLRAFYYFHLVQLFGDVHVTLEETPRPRRRPRGPPGGGLRHDPRGPGVRRDEPPRDHGRLRAGHQGRRAAPARQGAPHPRRRRRLRQAADYARAVIDGGQYALLPRWADVFDQRNERHREVVWAVQYTADPLTNGGGAQVGGGTTNYANGNQGPPVLPHGVRRAPGDAAHHRVRAPFKRFRPTDYLLNLYDQQHDARYRDGFQVMWRANNAGTIPRDASGRPRFAVGDTAVFLPGRQMTAAEIASKPYRIYTPSQYSTRIFPTTVKFLDPLRPSVSEEGGSRDYQVFRLAETYLIAAEGLLRSGRAADALPFINAVRRRAALPGSEAQMQLSAGQLTLDVILDERARELAAESMRWFDLVRTGTLLERVKAHNPDARDNIREHHVLRPIPQTQIDRTAGGRQTFPQNPGY
jgi:TonB-linked SusC/RagA family outer membrane protein